MTIRVLKSPAKGRNPGVEAMLREAGEDNLAWLQRAVTDSLEEIPTSRSALVLVGGSDPLSFRLRVAQSHVRHDLSPSAWSHVLFVSALEKSIGASAITEVSLMPPMGFGPFGYPAPSNGIQAGRLSAYASAVLFPNIALLSVPVAGAAIAASLAALKLQRSLLDCPELILKWLAYCWGVGVPATPLAEGFGMPSAAILEAAFAANGFDLTPGLESRSSCPEAIWQAAAWWQEYYKNRGRQNIRGAYSAQHDLVPDDLYGGSTRPKTTSTKRRPRRKLPRRR